MIIFSDPIVWCWFIKWKHFHQFQDIARTQEEPLIIVAEKKESKKKAKTIYFSQFVVLSRKVSLRTIRRRFVSLLSLYCHFFFAFLLPPPKLSLPLSTNHRPHHIIDQSVRQPSNHHQIDRSTNKTTNQPTNQTKTGTIIASRKTPVAITSTCAPTPWVVTHANGVFRIWKARTAFWGSTRNTWWSCRPSIGIRRVLRCGERWREACRFRIRGF